MKYYIKQEFMYGDEFMNVKDDCYGYDDTQEIAVFNTLDKAKELCEMGNEFVIDENENILYRGKECSDCMKNLRHLDDIVDDCDNCKNTGLVNMESKDGE